MPISEKNREDGVRTFVLPPLLTQHMLPVEGGRRPAARMEGSCNNSTPRTLEQLLLSSPRTASS